MRPSRPHARVAALATALCLAASAGATAPRQQDDVAPRPTLERIAALLQRDDLGAASGVLEPALKSYPADPVLHNLAGVIAARQGAFEPAETHFQTAIRLAPQAPASYENLGRLYQERADGNPAMRARAIATYQRLLDIDPLSVDALFQSGFLLALGGQFAESRSMLERLPDEFKVRPQTRAVLAAVLAGLGDTAAAHRIVEGLAADPSLTEADVLAAVPVIPSASGDEVAVAMLEALSRRSMASPRALQALAALYVRAARLAEARDVLERAVRTGGVSVPLLLELARTAVALKDHRAALGYLAHARSLEPSNATIHFFFGMVCVEQNLVREAYESLKRAVDLDPDNALTNYAMGAVSTHRHEASESLPYFEKYVRLKPADPRGHFAQGVALFYSNKLEEARPALQRAADAPETATGAHLFLGRIARQLNDLTTARREIELVLQLNANLPDAWAELGLIQTRSDEYEQAEQSLARALAMEPDHYAASVNLATLYAKSKDPRREAQAARVAALIEKREARTQEFLRIIQVAPGGQ